MDGILFVMGLFRSLFRGTKYLCKSTLYLGSLYTFFAYFYVQEVKHRLGDTEHTDLIDRNLLTQGIKTLQTQPGVDDILIELGIAIRHIETFYARAWHFRQFNELCHKFHHTVVRSVLKNYQEYGIFHSRKEMERSLRKDEVNPQILKKIMEVKEVNAQLTERMIGLYMEIVGKQMAMSTGTIMGLSEEEKGQIDLIYDYIEKGLYLASPSQEDYWKYKLVQSQIRKHNYSDAIFRLLYI